TNDPVKIHRSDSIAVQMRCAAGVARGRDAHRLRCQVVRGGVCSYGESQRWRSTSGQEHTVTLQMVLLSAAFPQT
ncbi:hypothetical protein IRJ41_015487, partial [Triplophysa rosa]